MAKISVALATYNEEYHLGDCLKAVKDWVDEMIVVDGESKDKTVEIAKKHGAQVFLTPNKPIFHLNKQMAIDKAKGDWILQLDADERVTPELRDEILEVTGKGKWKGGGKEEAVAYWIKRENFFLGKWLKKGGMYPDPVIRLFQRGKACLPCKSVHEQMEVKGKTGWLKNDLIHLNNVSFSRYLIHSNWFTTLEAEKMLRGDVGTGLVSVVSYIFIKPCLRFLELFIRHKGFLDGFPGFVFALYSGLHVTTSYVKYWERKNANRSKHDPFLDWN